MHDYQIVILSYNHPELTAQTIGSVLNLGFPAQHVVLVHNGSEQKHSQVLNEKFKDIKHIFLEANQGFTGGANFGLSEAFKTCDKALFLTNDTEALALPTQFPNAYDLFSVLISKRNSAHVDSVIGEVNLRTGTLTHIRNVNDLINSRHHKTYVPGSAFGITKTAFETLGGFDETFHTYWEDVDLSLRAHEKNMHIGHHLEFHVKHKIGKTCHKHRFYTLYLFQRNKKRFLARYSKSYFTFRLYYYAGMCRLAWRILKQPQKKTNFNFWWKALCDQNI